MTIYDLSVKDNKGQDVSLSQYKGKVLLIVNTATKCGFTPQYKALEALYKKYKDSGFEILDFPSNQFFHQAPGSDEEIDQFATINYGTTFPRFQKIEVNGNGESPLYAYLKSVLPGRISWNFNKFLVKADGTVYKRYASPVTPDKIEADIAALLGKEGVSAEITKKPEVKEITTLTLAMLTGCPPLRHREVGPSKSQDCLRRAQLVGRRQRPHLRGPRHQGRPGALSPREGKTHPDHGRGRHQSLGPRTRQVSHKKTLPRER
jgi:glutathione peroxidase